METSLNQNITKMNVEDPGNLTEGVLETVENSGLSRSASDPTLEKSNIVSLSVQSSNMDHPVHQVDDGHYLYRKGSTKVHVQTFDLTNENSYWEERQLKHSSLYYSTVKLTSGLVGMVIVVMTFVIKISAAVTRLVSKPAEDEFMLTLYVCGFLWVTYYIIKGHCKNYHQIKFSKSHESSNRWLKGVVVVFGLGIVLKDGLDCAAYMSVDLPLCTYNQVKTAAYFFNAFFIIAQIKYLFKFSKVYLRNCSVGSWMGLMFIIGVNLSIWIAAVVDETLEAFEKESSADYHEELIASVTLNVSKEEYDDDDDDDDDEDGQISFVNGDQSICSCQSALCSAVDTAQTFLFPFVIEFSLVASCLLYVTWKNIGRHPPPCQVVVKPNYQFYKKYTGVTVGGAAFFVTVIILVLLSTAGVDVDISERSYFTENSQLVIYDAFLMSLEMVMLGATVVGFFLFRRIPRPLEESSILDQVLLIICIFGVLTVSLFSMLAVLAGTDNKEVNWFLTFLHPFVEVIQCVVQMAFIIYGLKRQPITSEKSKEAAEHLKFGIDEHLRQTDSISGSTPDIRRNYLRSNRNSITSVVSKLANAVHLQGSAEKISETMLFSKGLQMQSSATAYVRSSGSTNRNTPTIVVSVEEDTVTTFSKNEEQIENGVGAFQSLYSEEDGVDNADEGMPQQTILKIISETKVAKPNKLRFWLRDTIMFLLVSNACLWIFVSLSGTAFVVYQYESIFYGNVAWTMVTMICRPLTIFFRMHSAGCLFEMWSFA